MTEQTTKTAIPFAEIECKDNRSYTAESIGELVANIRELSGGKNTLLQPILLKKTEEGYRIIDGRRRFWALNVLKVKELAPENYVLSEIEDETMASFAANFARKNLTLAEEVSAIGDLHKALADVTALARYLGKSVKWTAYRLNLLNLSPEWMDLLKKRDSDPEYAHLTPEVFEKVSRLPPKKQEEIAKKFCDEAFDSLCTTKELVNALDEDHNVRDLTHVVFPHEDCRTCPHGQMDGLALFQDETVYCFDAECYDRHLNKYLKTKEKEIEKSGCEMLMIRTGYVQSEILDERFRYNSMYINAEKIDETEKPNALVVYGAFAGREVHVPESVIEMYKKVDHHFIGRRNSKGEIVNAAKGKTDGSKESGAPKKRTLKEMELDLQKKRIKYAVSEMTSWLEGGDATYTELEKIFEPVNGGFHVRILSLAVLMGVTSTYESGVGYMDTPEIAEKMDSLSSSIVREEIHFRLFWKSLAAKIVNRISIENVPFANISEEHLDAKRWCSILHVEWKRFMDAAKAKVLPSKVLIEARAKAKK